MEHQNWTDMGGVRKHFLTTHWSLIENVQECDGQDQALIGLLLERYWKPVYCYLRRKGNDNEQAKDLTQGFFHDVVLNRQLLERAQSSKGRFRTLLLHALDQYVVDELRKERAQKRIPKKHLIPLEIAEPPVWVDTENELDAHESFNFAWKAELLDRVLTELKDLYCKRGKETHWYMFRDRVADPILQDCETPSLTNLCERYHIASEVVASNMVKTVKRRFRGVLRKHVRQTVISGEMVQEELLEIFKFLQKKRTV